MAISQFVYPFPFKANLGCFHLGALINKTAVDIHHSCMSLYGLVISFLLCTYLGIEWLDHMVGMFTLLKIATLFSKVVYVLSSNGYSICSISFPTLDYMVMFLHSGECVVISHCGVSLRLLTTDGGTASCPLPIHHLWIFFDKVSVQTFGPCIEFCCSLEFCGFFIYSGEVLYESPL